MPDTDLSDADFAQLYDLQNRWGADDDFFLALANERPRPVVDLGCGTGRLTLALAGSGHNVTGVDPDRAALELARSKPGAERVIWQEGTAALLPSAAFELALMTSHVAQAIVQDAEWAATLTDLRRALKPGGQLAFDSRDPAARGWTAWTSGGAGDHFELPDGRHATTWTQAVEVVGDAASGTVVRLVERVRVADSNHEIVNEATLRFRTLNQLQRSLSTAGFDLEQAFGGWHGEAVGVGTGELVVLARARS